MSNTQEPEQELKMSGIREVDNSGEVEIPGIKHKVIGLVSGGKDSTFNLLHCVANGHEVVALATLTPEAGIGTSPISIPYAPSFFYFGMTRMW